MPCPGAIKLVHVPKLLKMAYSSAEVLAATVYAPRAEAGEKRQASGPLLPAPTTGKMPGVPAPPAGVSTTREEAPLLLNKKEPGGGKNNAPTLVGCVRGGGGLKWRETKGFGLGLPLVARRRL